MKSLAGLAPHILVSIHQMTLDSKFGETLAVDIGNIADTGIEIPAIVTFAYDPPPAQSAAEFRRSFAESFQTTLAMQMRPASLGS
jgi:hypothetical protein